MRRFFWDKHSSFVDLQWRCAPNLLVGRTLQQMSILLSITGILLSCNRPLNAQTTYAPDHPFIQYTGRVDFSNPKFPKFWQPGVYISFQFKGDSCEVLLNDQELYRKHNYLELVVDGKAERLLTTSKTNRFILKGDAGKKIHSAIVVKNTEAGIGYLELAGIRCKELVKPTDKPTRKIECIGNSITCGSGSDESLIPCGKGQWFDQHNAWMSYGAITARSLNAQFHLSSVSGIGLMHSCCDMNIVMPQVFDKIDMRKDSIAWNFKNYQPDVLTVCLGQNDGIQDSAIFCINYISFLKILRTHYPNTMMVLLTSPMAGDQLRAFMKKSIASVASAIQASGDKKISTYVFEKQYKGGCGGHPSLQDHTEIAAGITAYLKRLMSW